jgi:hypothetical protein
MAAAAAAAQQELAALGHMPNEILIKTNSGRIVVLRPGPSQQDGQPDSPQILQVPGALQWHDLAFMPAQGPQGFAQHNGSGFLLTDDSRFNSLLPGLDTTLLMSSSGGGAQLTAAAAAAAFGSTVGLDMLVEPAEGLHAPAAGGAQLMHVGGGDGGKPLTAAVRLSLGQREGGFPGCMSFQVGCWLASRGTGSRRLFGTKQIP